MTASVTSSPRKLSASSFRERRIKEESSSAVNSFFPRRYFLPLPMLRLNTSAAESGYSAMRSLAVSPT